MPWCSLLEFFRGYISYLENKLNGKIIDLKFRDKSKGWGHMTKAIYEKNGSIREKLIIPIASYYFNYFLKSDICRESCYECKYACSSREGDFTMGDYWGVEKAHPEIKSKKGVSVLLVNSNTGMALLNDLSRYINLTESTFEQARIQNGPLNKPNIKSDRREIILKLWHEGGYKAVSDDYYTKNKKQIILFKFKMLIPRPIKKGIKRLIGRV